MIPFKYGVFVTGKDFCGRQPELALLHDYIKSSMRVYIVGERRLGKSSLIMEAVRTLPDYEFIYIDLRAIVTKGQLCERIANGINDRKKSRSSFHKLIKAMANLRPEISIDAITGDLKLSISPQIQISESDITGLLQMAGGKKKVIIFDEFQDIQRLNEFETILGSIRTEVQTQDETTFIFCGSILNKMSDLFTSRSSAFFNSAQKMALQEINPKEFQSFLQSRFESGNRKVSPSATSQILELCKGNPGDIQRLCIGIWNQTSENEEIDSSAVLKGMANICALESDSYSERLDSLSRNQILCLGTLLKLQEPFTLSNKLAVLSGLGSYSNLKSAIKGLEDKDILIKRNHKWFMSNPFFFYWLHFSELI